MPTPTIESHANSISSGGTTTTIAVTAAGAGRVIVVSTTIGCIGSVAPSLSISGGGANVGAWTSIGNLGPAGVACLIQSWFALTTGSVSAATVTITSSLTIDDAATVYITVAGANTTQPLDQNTTLARGASNGSAAFSRSVGAPIAWTVSTNTANVLIFGQVGANANQAYGSPLANSTLTETVNNAGGSFFANIADFTAPFTAQQTGTTIGSSANNAATVTGIAFGVTADSQVAHTTWNPSDKTGSMTLSGGNLTATGGVGSNAVRAVHCLRSGKYYWEYTATTWAGSSACGLNTSSATIVTPSANTVISLNANGSLNINGLIAIAFGARANGDVVCFAVDFDNQLVWVRVGAAGNWNNSTSYNPATGVGGVSYLVTPIGVQTLYPWAYSGTSGNAFTANFGDSAFTGAVPAGFTSGVPAVTPPLIAADTQIALEQWAMPNAQAQLTQIAQELWCSVGGTAAKSGVYTYPIAGTRAGLSGIVAETQTKTYAVAMPAVLSESYVAPPVVTGPSTQGARVMIMA